MVAFNCAPSPVLLFLQLGLTTMTAQGCQAMRTSGGTGDTWLPFLNPEVEGIA